MKMDVLLATPVAVAVLIGSYGLSKWSLHHKDPSTNSHDLLFKCESMAVGMFFVGTSFLLKGLLGGFDCSRDHTNGKLYLDIDPGIECYTDAHTSIHIKATVGLMMWGGAMGKIAHTFLREGGKYRYSFLTTKLEDRWFWWELLLLARKTAIMACGLFNTSETARGWYCGSLVIIVAMAAHAYARPYKCVCTHPTLRRLARPLSPTPFSDALACRGAITTGMALSTSPSLLALCRL